MTLKQMSTEQLHAILDASNLEEIDAILNGATDDPAPLFVGESVQDYSFTPVIPCRIMDTSVDGGILSAGETCSYYVCQDTL